MLPSDSDNFEEPITTESFLGPDSAKQPVTAPTSTNYFIVNERNRPFALRQTDRLPFPPRAQFWAVTMIWLILTVAAISLAIYAKRTAHGLLLAFIGFGGLLITFIGFGRLLIRINAERSLREKWARLSRSGILITGVVQNVSGIWDGAKRNYDGLLSYSISDPQSNEAYVKQAPFSCSGIEYAQLPNAGTPLYVVFVDKDKYQLL